MRITLGTLAAVAVFAAACDNSATSPRDRENALLAFDQAATTDAATGVARGPIMNRQLPDSIKLTDAQKASIKALHDAFAAAHATQFAQLKAIHEQARAAHKAGATRAEIMVILDKGKPIMDAMKPDFEALRAAVGAILTSAQKAWFEAHRRGDGGPMGVRHMGMPGRP